MKKRMIVFMCVLLWALSSCSLLETSLDPMENNASASIEDQAVNNPLVDEGDYYLLGGDIILLKDEPNHKELINHLSGIAGHSRACYTATTLFWPKNATVGTRNFTEIRYYFKDTFSATDKETILSAMQHIESVANIEFTEFDTSTKKPGIHILKIENGGERPGVAGAATLGYVNYPRLILYNDKYVFSTVLHELMHVLGFHHEHQRHDRGFFIEVIEENILPELLNQFTAYKLWESALLTQYDYSSVMHYRSMAGSVDGQKTTMKRKIPSSNPIPMNNNSMGGDALSSMDKSALQTIYGASPEKWMFLAGDFNGDGLDEILSFEDDRGWRVYDLNQGTMKGKRWTKAGLFEINMVGDFTGDGRDDLLQYTSQGWRVGRSTGTSFSHSIWSTANKQDIHIVGDFCGDEKDDVLIIDTDSAYSPWTVLESNGSSFITRYYLAGYQIGSATVLTGNFRRESGDDQKDEVVVYRPGEGWEVSIFTDEIHSGTTALRKLEKKKWTSAGNFPAWVGDFDGDGKDDLLQRLKNGWRVLRSRNNKFDAETWSSDIVGKAVTVGDFNGDGKSDIMQYIPSQEKWMSLLSDGVSFISEYKLIDKATGALQAYDVIKGKFRNSGGDDLFQYKDQSWWLAFITLKRGKFDIALYPAFGPYTNCEDYWYEEP